MVETELKMEKILYHHQAEALEAITASNASLGRIVIPTGGGKTLVQALTLRDRLNVRRGGKVHLVLAPRIVLLNQLIKNYRDEIGQDYLAVAFHSGRHEPDYSKIRWEETSTTNVDVVTKNIERAKRMKKDLVVFSTYCSMHKLMDIRFNTIIADESQYCVTEGFFEPIRDLTAKLKLFFTATERHTKHDNGRGLNNEEVFGEKLYQVSPKTLADRGIIVLPRLHIMKADAKSSVSTIVDEVLNLAKAQSMLKDARLPVTKILFAMEGTSDVEEIASQYVKIATEMPGYRTFTITSKGGAKVDGKTYTRDEWMKQLRECDNALIFHYDILAEGIDVDGITGVCILRNMKQSKLLQTIGRAVRIYKANPELKRNCWVSVPVINDDQESYRFVSDIIAELNDGGFDINAEMVDFTNMDGVGIGDDDGIDDAYGNKSGASLKQWLLENVVHQIEIDGILAEMSLEDQFAALLAA